MAFSQSAKFQRTDEEGCQDCIARLIDMFAAATSWFRPSTVTDLDQQPVRRFLSMMATHVITRLG